MTNSNATMRFSLADAGMFLLISLGWIVCSLSQMVRRAPHMLAVGVLAGVLFIAIVMAGSRWYQRRPAVRQLHWAWLAAFWLLIAVLYAVVYHISQRHIFGPGSDSEDALRIAGSQMLQLHFPYYLHTYLGNAITPMPGATMLAIPFLLMGRVSFQNLVWMAAFILFCAKFFRFRSTALAYLLIFVLAAPDVLNDIAVGDDYCINTFYICTLTFLFLRTYQKNASGWQHIAAGILLGFALSSRPTYIVIPPLALAYMLQQDKGTMTALRSFALPILVAAVITVPFYLYDPAHFSPSHVTGKLNFMAPLLAHILLVLLPVLAVLISCSGFFVRLTMPRLFLLAGIGSAVILMTSGLIAFGIHNSNKGFESLDYSKAAVIFFALWAFSRFESIHQKGQPMLN